MDDRAIQRAISGGDGHEICDASTLWLNRCTSNGGKLPRRNPRRDWRKEVASAEGVPVYTVFTNEQLAAIVQKKTATKAALQEIEGVGEARVKKYGDAMIEILRAVETGEGEQGQ